MQNIKYHVLSLSAAIIFSYVTALTINGIVRYNLEVNPSGKRSMKTAGRIHSDLLNVNVDQMLESGFFGSTSSGDNEQDSGVSSEISDLKLIGTVTGPPEIARALIQKKGEKNPEIFKLKKDVYGYTLVSVKSSEVHLKKNGEILKLNLYDKKEFGSPGRSTSNTSDTSGGKVTKNISRAEMQQKVMNNIDNAMRGIQAGPYRENGQIEGFKMIRIRPYNILYEYGIRSGDIIKRINGKKVDSTEKLFNMWQGMKDESKMLIDIERNKQIITFELNITD